MNRLKIEKAVVKKVNEVFWNNSLFYENYMERDLTLPLIDQAVDMYGLCTMEEVLKMVEESTQYYIDEVL